MDEKVIRRFWSKVDMRWPDECWEWLTSRRVRGYGEFAWGKRTHSAHRFAYALTYGEIPKGMVVRHKCDNPPCCNPNHLELGTIRDNWLDVVGRGRYRPCQGETHGAAKLTNPEVLAIRANADGLTQKQLGERYGVCTALISHIRNRKAWTHI